MSLQNLGSFDSGYIAIHQHIFAKKLYNLSQQRTGKFRLINEVGFQRQVAMFKDVRLEQFYPVQPDVDEALVDMLRFSPRTDRLSNFFRISVTL